MTAAYPLSWPDTMPRTTSREAGSFKTTLLGAIKNVEDSLRLFGRDAGKPVSNVILSSNVSPGVQTPEDPGIAAWFTWEGQQLCIAVDRYTKPEANLQAIHHIIEARRTELRHGTLHLVRATFKGFMALPAPPGQHWTEVMGLPANTTKGMITARYRELAADAHPDKPGGSEAAMARLNAARDVALRAVGG